MKTAFWYTGHKVEIDPHSEHENPIEVAIDDKDLTGAFRVSGLPLVMFAHFDDPWMGRIEVFLDPAWRRSNRHRSVL